MKEIQVQDIVRKPKDSVQTIEIMGVKFAQMLNDAKVFVLVTDDIIEDEDDIYFYFENSRYLLMGCHAHEIDNKNYKMVECRYWQEKLTSY